MIKTNQSIDLSESDVDKFLVTPEALEVRPDLVALRKAARNDHALLIGGLIGARKRRGLSQSDLAERVGLSQGRLSQIESTHEEVSLLTIITLLEALEGKLNITLEVDDIMVASIEVEPQHDPKEDCDKQ